MPVKKHPMPRSLKLHAMRSAGGAAGGAGGCGNPLGFTMQPQQQTQWCWAAVSVSVNLYYHPASGQTQCAVANTAMGQTTCCVDGSTAQCNQPWFLDQALQIVGNLNVVTSGKAALTRIKAEIDHCRPLCLRIAWNGGGGHFVAVYGYTHGYISIGDPWYGNSVVTYASFPSTYQVGGSWTDSYTTKA
ncbi:MAG TPA: papain-like cysteine protease family protein [Casimicrobiaceae bacterium]